MMNLMNTLHYLKRKHYTRVPKAPSQRATPLLYPKPKKSQCWYEKKWMDNKSNI